MQIHRVLLTGGTGFLGAHILYDLCAQGYDVIALKRPSSSTRQTKKIFKFRGDANQTLFRQILWKEADVLDYESLIVNLEGVDAIVHAAAVVSFNPSRRAEMIRDNEDAAANLIDACLQTGVRHLCHISSIAALGHNPKGGAVNESCGLISYEGKNAYGIAKFKAEMQMKRGRELGLNITVLNPAIILGPGDWKKGSPKFFDYIASRIPFYAGGGEGFVDVRDVSSIVVNSMQNESVQGKSFLLCATNMSFADLFRQIAQALKTPAPIFRIPNALSGVAALLAEAWSYCSGKEPFISRDSIKATQKQSFYDGSLIEQSTDFRYTDFSQTILFTAKCYRKDHPYRK